MAEAPLAPAEFFALFHEKFFSVSAPANTVLRPFSADVLSRRLDPRIQQLRISYISSRYAEITFEEKYDQPQGFTVRDVVLFVREYYTSNFTPEQVAQIREHVARGAIKDNYVHLIARLPPRPFTWLLPDEMTEEHVDNYIRHFNLPRDDALVDRMWRICRHAGEHSIKFESLTEATGYQNACFFHPRASLSWQEVTEQCQALGLPVDEKQLWEHVRAGRPLADLSAISLVRDTCQRHEIMGDMRRFEGFDVVEAPANANWVQVAVRLGS